MDTSCQPDDLARLPPLERAGLGANGSVFASPEVRGLYELLFAESWPVEVNLGRFRSDAVRLQVLGRTAGILGDLEAASAASSAPTGSRP